MATNFPYSSSDMLGEFYDPRSAESPETAAELLAQLAQTPVQPEVSTPTSLEELLAAQGPTRGLNEPPPVSQAPAFTLPEGVTQADLDAIAAQFRDAGYKDQPAINFTGDPNNPFFDMRLPDGKVNPVFFDQNFDFTSIPNVGSPVDQICPAGEVFDPIRGICVNPETTRPATPTCPPNIQFLPIFADPAIPVNAAITVLLPISTLCPTCIRLSSFTPRLIIVDPIVARSIATFAPTSALSSMITLPICGIFMNSLSDWGAKPKPSLPITVPA